MITTLFVTRGSGSAWQAEFLEFSFRKAEQSGRLVNLRALNGEGVGRLGRTAGAFATTSWAVHPFLRDEYPAYDVPAALLEWSLSEPEPTTLLVLPANAVFTTAVEVSVEPGNALGQAWEDLALDPEQPFGLGLEFAPLQAYSVQPANVQKGVRGPYVLHSSDLGSVAARWLEWTGLLRHSLAQASQIRQDSIAYGYLMAAAERGIGHEVHVLAADVGGTEDGSGNGERALLLYGAPVLDTNGNELWDPMSEDPLSFDGDPADASTADGRALLGLLAEFIAERQAPSQGPVPRRRENVIEGKVAGRLLVFAPGKTEGVSLDASDRMVWDLCDGVRSFSEILSLLQERRPWEGELEPQLRSRLESFETAGILHLT